jgi:ABC-type glycerol-3-phosphate transport system permease component
MAGAVVITAPLVVGFLLAQRRFTAAIASAGMR